MWRNMPLLFVRHARIALTEIALKALLYHHLTVVGLPGAVTLPELTASTPVNAGNRAVSDGLRLAAQLRMQPPSHSQSHAQLLRMSLPDSKRNHSADSAPDGIRITVSAQDERKRDDPHAVLRQLACYGSDGDMIAQLSSIISQQSATFTALVRQFSRATPGHATSTAVTSGNEEKLDTRASTSTVLALAGLGMLSGTASLCIDRRPVETFTALNLAFGAASEQATVNGSASPAALGASVSGRRRSLSNKTPEALRPVHSGGPYHNAAATIKQSQRPVAPGAQPKVTFSKRAGDSVDKLPAQRPQLYDYREEGLAHDDRHGYGYALHTGGDYVVPAQLHDPQHVGSGTHSRAKSSPAAALAADSAVPRRTSLADFLSPEPYFNVESPRGGPAISVSVPVTPDAVNMALPSASLSSDCLLYTSDAADE